MCSGTRRQEPRWSEVFRSGRYRRSAAYLARRSSWPRSALPMMITSRCQRPSLSRTRITGTAEWPGLSRICSACPKPPAPTASAVHLDGARIFNASVATGADVQAVARYANTVSFCLSKGLCCPVGSPSCAGQPGRSGKPDAGARWWAGVCGKRCPSRRGPGGLATMTGRLANDHGNARSLAEGLAEMPGIVCDLSRVQTNIVYFRLKNIRAADFLTACSDKGVLGGEFGGRELGSVRDPPRHQPR